MTVSESLFPNLRASGYVVTSPPEPRYNCIAHTAGDPSRWWWPDPDGFDYWPPGVVREQSLTSFIQAFARLGYVTWDNGDWEEGREKVAIYATEEGPSHAARQVRSGRWTSKLGPDDDIEHALDGLVGSIYGTVVQFLARPMPSQGP